MDFFVTEILILRGFGFFCYRNFVASSKSRIQNSVPGPKFKISSPGQNPKFEFHYKANQISFKKLKSGSKKIKFRPKNLISWSTQSQKCTTFCIELPSKSARRSDWKPNRNVVSCLRTMNGLSIARSCVRRKICFHKCTLKLQIWTLYF